LIGLSCNLFELEQQTYEPLRLLPFVLGVRGLRGLETPYQPKLHLKNGFFMQFQKQK
jgi:hypothetical protein